VILSTECALFFLIMLMIKYGASLARIDACRVSHISCDTSTSLCRQLLFMDSAVVDVEGFEERIKDR